MKKVIMKKVTLKKLCLRRDLTFFKNLYLKVPSFVGIFFVMFELRIMIAAKDFLGELKRLYNKYFVKAFCN